MTKQRVNYITQNNEASDRFYRDERIRPIHIALYAALFHRWNTKRFSRTFTISRERIMDRAKIDSKTTYHRILRQLHEWKYIVYYPTNNPARGSKIEMIIFYTPTDQKLDTSVPSPNQKLAPLNKPKQEVNNNQMGKPDTYLVVVNYFKKNGLPESEARRFYEYYQQRDWKLSRGLRIKNWHDAVERWIKNGLKGLHNEPASVGQWMDHLKTRKNKNYGEPL